MIKSLEEISKIKDETGRRVEMLLGYDELYRAYKKIENLRDHVNREVAGAYCTQYGLEQYGGDANIDPKEQINKVISILEKGLKEAKLLRDHSHQWIDRYGDGRDLSCVCNICGCAET